MIPGTAVLAAIARVSGTPSRASKIRRSLVIEQNATIPSGARVGVPGGDLDITQVYPGVQHRGHKRVLQHVRMHPR